MTASSAESPCTPARSPRSPESAAPCAWRSQVLAYFDTDGLSNGGTEAINMLIERHAASPTATATSPTTDSRMLLAASGTRTHRTT